MVNLGTNFYQKLVQVSSEVGMKPEDLLVVMVSESGLNPAAVEKKFKGSGLVGFMPSTLKNLGFKGNWSDFIKLSGEDQLDYVRQLVKSYSGFNNGRPFESATQYYIANFFPVALRLPGIQSQDPSAAFIEEKPAVVIDRKTGKKYSKKYFNVGYRISPEYESEVYKENKLFHGSTPGAITYGDMANRVEHVKTMPLYQQALASLKHTGYESKETFHRSTSSIASFIKKIKKLLSMFAFASNEKNIYLISVGSSLDFETSVEFASVLSQAINDYFKVPTKLCADKPTNIEVECEIAGDKKIIVTALKELVSGLSDAFAHSTKKIGNIQTFGLVNVGFKSIHTEISPNLFDIYHRRFLLKFAGLNK